MFWKLDDGVFWKCVVDVGVIVGVIVFDLFLVIDDEYDGFVWFEVFVGYVLDVGWGDCGEVFLVVCLVGVWFV